MSRSLSVSICLFQKFKDQILTLGLQQKIYSDVFARWPKQALRPDHQLQDVLGKAVTERFQNYKPSMEREELLKARALQFLLQDRYNDRVRTTT
jgi:hypothetical protein